MKKNLFNFAKALLLGFAFVAVGCSDYDEDIKALNDRIDQEIIAGKIDPLKVDLEKTAASLTAAQAALENEIKAAHAEDVKNLNAADENLQSAINAANAAIVDLQSELNGKIDGVESNFNDQIASVNQKIAEANAAIDALEAADLKNKDAEFTAEIAGLKEQAAALKSELDEKIAANAAGIAANAAAIEEINKNLEAQAAVFAEFQTAVNGKLAALEAADEAINAAIATLDASVKTLEATKLNVADFNAYKTEVAALFEAVNNSLASLEATTVSLMLKDIALDAKDAELTKSIKQLETTAAGLQSQLDEAFAGIAINTANIAALQVSVNKELKKLRNDVDKNADAIATLEAKATALETAFNAYKAEVADAILSIEEKDKDQDGKIQLNADAIKALQDKDDEIDAAIAELDAAIAAINVDINKLMNRVQSIVYVPTHVDGKATINYGIFSFAAADGTTVTEKVIEAASTMEYQVYPADCASAIAALWNAAENKEDVLNFDIKSVAFTRAEAAALNITNVVADAETGVLTLTVEARNFGDDFYAANEEKSYSVSLVFNKKENADIDAANLSSCYTNLAPQSKRNATQITAVLNAENTDSISIAYTKRNAPGVALEAYEKKAVLKDNNVRYVIDNVQYTYAEMIKNGYAVEAPKFNYTVKGFEVKRDDKYAVVEVVESADVIKLFSCDTIYSPADATEANVLEATKEFAAKNDVQPWVSLTKEATADKVGNYIVYTANYDVMGQELSAEQKIGVAPYEIAFDATVANVVWNYDQDAEQDSYGDAGVYSRENLVLVFSEDVDAKLDGIKLDSLISSGYGGISVKVGDAENYGSWADSKLSAARIANGADNTVVLAKFAGFKWNEKYNIKYVYKTLPSVEVTINVAVETKGRSDDEILITKEASIALEKNLVFKASDAKTPVVSLGEIYENLNAREDYDLGSFAGKKDEFMKEVLVDNKYAEYLKIEGLVNGEVKDTKETVDKASTWTTSLIVDNAKAEATVGFSYQTYQTFIPTSVVYTKEITLWYGQKVKLVYTLKFTDPVAGYDFIANKLWVFEKEGAYYSQVQGRYTDANGKVDKKTNNLKTFGVDNIDMDQAFYVAKAGAFDKPFSPEQLEELGLVTEFVLEETVPGVTIDDNVITYNGKADMVGVTGKLYLKHDGQSGLYEIKTNFDKGGIYENYNVLKFDPFTKVGAPEAEVTVEVTEIKEYVIPALSLFEMYESRLGDGEKSTPVVNLFDKNSANGYFVGNGSNGWANQSTYAEIYPTASFAPKFSKVGHEIPDAFANAIRWENISNDPNEEIWALIFDNTYNMSLQEVVEIPITLTVDYLWAPAKEEDRTATVTVKFINPELK